MGEKPGRASWNSPLEEVWVGSSQAPPRWNLATNNNKKNKHLLSAFSMPGIVPYMYHLIKSSEQPYEMSANIIPILWTRKQSNSICWPEVTRVGNGKAGIITQIFVPDFRDPALIHPLRGAIFFASVYSSFSLYGL